jgi:hypothetical protein
MKRNQVYGQLISDSRFINDIEEDIKLKAVKLIGLCNQTNITYTFNPAHECNLNGETLQLRQEFLLSGYVSFNMLYNIVNQVQPQKLEKG